MSERRCVSIATLIATCAFVISGTLPIRAIWIEIPTLSRQVPEGSNFYIYVLVIAECSNIWAIVYFLVRKCSSRRMTSDVRIIYASLVLAIVSMIVPGMFWKNAIPGVNISFSFTLLLSVFLASTVASLSAMTYVPFVCRLKNSYLNAAMIGEALSSLIPHVMALVQGIGRQPECSAFDQRRAAVAAATATTAANVSASGNSSSSMLIQQLSSSDFPKPTAQALNQRATVVYHHSTKMASGSSLQFSEQVYFLANAGFVCLSLLSFLTIRCTTSFRSDGAAMKASPAAGAAAASGPGRCIEVRDQTTTVNKRDKKGTGWQSKGSTLSAPPSQSMTVLDDGTVRQSAILHLRPPTKTTDPITCAEQTPLTGNLTPGHSDDCDTTTNDFNSQSQQPHQQQQHHHLSKSSATNPLRRYGRVSSTDRLTTIKASAGQRPKLFALLMLIALWSSFLMNGPLSSVYAYSCYSVGNNAFLAGVILCDVVTLLSCILSSRTTEMTVMIAFSCLGTILLTYFLALIIFTLQTQTKEIPPFGNTGEILTVGTSHDCFIEIIIIFTIYELL